MKTLKKLFLLGMIATFSLCACDLLNGLFNPENEKEVAEKLIKKNIQGTWEVTHVLGYEQRWNSDTEKNEIVSIDRDVTPTVSDHWSYRIKFSADQISSYAYEEDGWTERGENNYYIEGYNIIMIQDAKEERVEISIVSINNNKLVLEIPLESDASKATILSLYRLEAEEDYEGEGSEIKEDAVRKIIKGTWQVVHVSGFVDYWNSESNTEEIRPIDRDVLASKDDEFYIRTKFDGSEMRFYKYNGTNWEQKELYVYKVEGRKILLMLHERGETQAPAMELTVYSIKSDVVELGYELIIDPTKSTKLIIERV